MTDKFEIFPQNVIKDGTLIIIQKGLKLYNINDVVDILNALHDENEQLKQQLECEKQLFTEENQRLKKQLHSEHTMLDNAILLERTRMGQNSLKQYKEAIQ